MNYAAAGINFMVDPFAATVKAKFAVKSKQSCGEFSAAECANAYKAVSRFLGGCDARHVPHKWRAADSSERNPPHEYSSETNLMFSAELRNSAKAFNRSKRATDLTHDARGVVIDAKQPTRCRSQRFSYQPGPCPYRQTQEVAKRHRPRNSSSGSSVEHGRSGQAPSIRRIPS